VYFVCFVVVKSVDDRFRITTKYTKHTKIKPVLRSAVPVEKKCRNGIRGVAKVAAVTALPSEDLNCHSKAASPNFT